MLACSQTAAAGGAMAGAALILDRPGDPPLCGPWVGELFRHPDAPPGTGAALLAAALDRAAADGLPHVGLRVSSGNPALRLYERLGFTPTRSSVAVLVPPA
jgi:GNAT superfamily N-acetyltransferase